VTLYAGGALDALPALDLLRKVYVEPTNACNLDCCTCVRHAWDEPEGLMAWPVYERVVEGLAAPATVAFMGLGEPLLHPRLVDSVRTPSPADADDSPSRAR
jgi:MoaA/NifB/PqqE/SkfB family radical SAM enzyme